jgi:hypothetical protein
VEYVVVAQDKAQCWAHMYALCALAAIEGRTFLDYFKLLFGLVTDDLSHENYVT